MTSLTLNEQVFEDPFCKPQSEGLQPVNMDGTTQAAKDKKYAIYNYVFIISYPQIPQPAESLPLFHRWEQRP